MNENYEIMSIPEIFGGLEHRKFMFSNGRISPLYLFVGEDIRRFGHIKLTRKNAKIWGACRLGDRIARRMHAGQEICWPEGCKLATDLTYFVCKNAFCLNGTFSLQKFRS